jgi:hypothetical protein
MPSQRLRSPTCAGTQPVADSFLFYDRASMKFHFGGNDAVATADVADLRRNPARG